MARKATVSRGDPTVEALEIELLLEGLYRRSGFDFRGYAPAWRRDRIAQCQKAEGVATLTALLERILHDPACMDRVVEALLMPLSRLFDHPGHLKAFRERIVPALRTYPFVRIWHAGCGNGLETLAMTIVLHEEGLLDRTRLYATDICQLALDCAKAARYPAAMVAEAEADYAAAGGRARLADYCEIAGDTATFAPFLREHVLLARHNLVTDSSFNEFNVVVCRHVLAHFDSPLQERAVGLFGQSLARLGFLGFAPGDPVRSALEALKVEPLDPRSGWYRRVR